MQHIQGISRYQLKMSSLEDNIGWDSLVKFIGFLWILLSCKSPILGTTITLQRLKKRGYVSLTELHLQLNPSLGACPVFSGWPAWFILSLVEGLGGVLKV